MVADFTDMYICTRCRGRLASKNSSLICQACREIYPIVGDIPILVPRQYLPRRVPDPGLPFAEAVKLAEHLSTVPGDFATLVDEYYERCRYICVTQHNLFEHSRQITKARRVGAVSDEIATISLALQMVGCLYPQTRRVVEFGCGWGFSLAAVARTRENCPVLHGAEVHGLDLNPAILVLAKRLCRDLGLDNVHLAVADAQLPLPFLAKSVDMVYSNGVVEHIPAQDQLMRNLSETLSDESVLHFLVPNRYMIHPEPHFNVRFVGFVPRKYQTKYLSARLKITEDLVEPILSYAPSDLNDLMSRHFPRDLLTAIPVQPYRSSLARVLTRFTLGLMAVGSYHCVVHRTAKASPADADRGRLLLSSIPFRGRIKPWRVYQRTAAMV